MTRLGVYHELRVLVLGLRSIAATKRRGEDSNQVGLVLTFYIWYSIQR
jgi:hypothetical protein